MSGTWRGLICRVLDRHHSWRLGRRGDDSAVIPGSVRIRDGRLWFPRLDWMTLRRRGGNPYPDGVPRSVAIKRICGKWHAVFCYEVAVPKWTDDGEVVGVDMNMRQVTASDGEVFTYAGHRRLEARNKRYARRLARQRRGSRRRQRTRARLARQTAGPLAAAVPGPEREAGPNRGPTPVAPGSATRAHAVSSRGAPRHEHGLPGCFPSGDDVHSAHASGPRRRGCGQLRAVMRAGSGRRRRRHETTGAKVVSRVLSARRNARFPALRGLEPFPVAAGHQVPPLNRRGPARPRRATTIRTTDPRTCSPRRRTGPRPTGPRADSPSVRPSR